MTQDFSRTDLDNYRKKHLKAKNADYISRHNEKLIKDFYTTIKGNMDKKTEQKYLIRWKMLLKRYIDSSKDGIETEKLDELTRMEWSQIMDDIQEDQEKNYADSTIDTYKNAIRMFYKKRHLPFNRPDRVKAILQSDSLKDIEEDKKERKRDKNILTPQQVRKMCEVAENARDSLLPIFLLDCGARTAEVEELTVGSVYRRTSPWEVTFHDAKNNKDDRELPMVHCQEKLRNWIENHPDSDNPDAPLWVVLTNSGQAKKGTKMSQENLNDRLKALGRKADLEGVDPDTLTVYDFRHSSATFRGTEVGLAIQQMMWWFAWKKPSRAKTYCEDDNERMKNAIKERHGFDVEDEDQETSLDTKWCGRCESERSADAQYCPVCSLPLDSETAIKDSELREAGKRVVEMKLDGKVEDEKLSEIVNGLAERR